MAAPQLGDNPQLVSVVLCAGLAVHCHQAGRLGLKDTTNVWNGVKHVSRGDNGSQLQVVLATIPLCRHGQASLAARQLSAYYITICSDTIHCRPHVGLDSSKSPVDSLYVTCAQRRMPTFGVTPVNGRAAGTPLNAAAIRATGCLQGRKDH